MDPGLEVEVLTDVSRQDIENAIRAGMRRASRGVIVHLVGHGLLSTRAREVCFQASDGLPEDPAYGRVGMRALIDALESQQERLDGSSPPYVLLLLDFCHVGEVTWPRTGIPKAERDRWVWAIVAAGADELTFDGEFTAAVINVLDSIRRRELNLAPHVEFLPLATFAKEIERARHRIGRHQDVQLTATVRPHEDRMLPFLRNPGFDPLTSYLEEDLTVVAKVGFHAFGDYLAAVAVARAIQERNWPLVVCNYGSPRDRRGAYE